jgi:hypothetical protein
MLGGTAPWGDPNLVPLTIFFVMGAVAMVLMFWRSAWALPLWIRHRRQMAAEVVLWQ